MKFLFFCLILISLNCFAQIELLYFRSTSQNQVFILPKKLNESPSEAVNRYKESFKNHSDLLKVVSLEQLKLFQLQQIENKNSFQDRPSVLILANRGYDQTSEMKTGPQLRIKKFTEQFKKQNNLFVLPVAAAIGLNEIETLQFHQLLTKNINGVLALGGADISPELYNQEAIDSRDVNLSRDFYEISFLKHWINSKKGFLFGVCRGHQLVAAALGFKLVQHIKNHGDGEWQNHLIRIKNTKLNRFQNLFSKSVVEVNSYHHQAVEYSKNENIEVAALALDGTVESLESKDGLILTTQFHPEFMHTNISNKIFKLVNSILWGQFRNQCRHIF